MKYLVCWAWEMDGHAGASSMVCSTLATVKQYIDMSLDDGEGGKMGKVTSVQAVEDGYDYYGTWECGDFSIYVRKFKNFSDMVNKEVFSRTG